MRTLIILTFDIQDTGKKYRRMVPSSRQNWCLFYITGHILPQKTASGSCSHKIQLSTAPSLMNDRHSQVNPEDSRNRDTTAAASLTEAQPHFMNERAFQLLLRLQLVWAGASQRWSNHMWLNMPLQEARAAVHMFHLGNSD